MTNWISDWSNKLHTDLFNDLPTKLQTDLFNDFPNKLQTDWLIDLSMGQGRCKDEKKNSKVHDR